MNDVVADTNAIIWYFEDPAQLTTRADDALTAAERTGSVLVSTVTLVELVYLSEKGRVDPTILGLLRDAIRDEAQPYDSLPLSIEVTDVVNQIPRLTVPDMPDRLIAATALAHGVPLVTADRKIRSLAISGLTIIW